MRAQTRHAGPMLVSVISAVLGAATLGPCAAYAADPADARFKVITYAPNLVLPLTLFVGYHVHIEFDQDEKFLNLGAGDTSALDVGPEGNHLFLKARHAMPTTNLTILTNRRVYFVEYQALARTPRPGEAVYSIAFRYPISPIESVEGDHEGDAGRRVELSRAATEYRNYWYCGPSGLRPVAAVDDGLQLRLSFAPRTALPTIYEREADGAETLVNTHVEQDVLVVHRLAEHLVLRRGGSVGCLVDRNHRPTERRAVRGTVDDSVERTTREVLP